MILRIIFLWITLVFYSTYSQYVNHKMYSLVEYSYDYYIWNTNKIEQSYGITDSDGHHSHITAIRFFSPHNPGINKKK